MVKFLKIIILTVLGISIIFFLCQKILSPEESPPSSAGQKEEILKNLTLEQKIGQLFLIGFEGKTLTPQLENLIKKIHPGGVLLLSRNIADEDQLKTLIGNLQRISISETNLPLFVAVDQEGGSMSRIDWLAEKTSQSEIKNIEQAYQIGLIRGEELKNLGINLNLAPILDIVQPNDFLYNRSFQKNPEETGELAKSLILGQKTAGILTAVKHFPGYGGISFNPEREKLPVLLEVPEISQFKKALEAGPELVMTANVIYTEIDEEFPLPLSLKGIDFLKIELKGSFLIISDDLSSPVLKKEFSLKNTVISALKAGVDLLLVAGFDEPEDSLRSFNFLLEAVEKGEITQEKIDESVLKTIKLKQNLLK